MMDVEQLYEMLRKVQEPKGYYFNKERARTIELLDAMRRHGVRHFIFSSTAAVYGEPVKVPIASASEGMKPVSSSAGQM